MANRFFQPSQVTGDITPINWGLIHQAAQQRKAQEQAGYGMLDKTLDDISGMEAIPGSIDEKVLREKYIPGVEAVTKKYYNSNIKDPAVQRQYLQELRKVVDPRDLKRIQDNATAFKTKIKSAQELAAKGEWDPSNTPDSWVDRYNKSGRPTFDPMAFASIDPAESILKTYGSDIKPTELARGKMDRFGNEEVIKGIGPTQILDAANRVAANEIGTAKGRQILNHEGYKDEQIDKMTPEQQAEIIRRYSTNLFAQKAEQNREIQKKTGYEQEQLMYEREALRRKQEKEESEVQPSIVYGDRLGSTAYQSIFAGDTKSFQDKVLTAKSSDTSINSSILDDKGNFTNPISPERFIKRDPNDPEGGIMSTQDIDRYNEYKKDFDQKKQNAASLVFRIKELYPEESKGKTPKQLFDMVNSDKSKYNISMSNEIPIVHKGLQTMIADQIGRSPDNAEVFIRNNDGNITDNWQGKKGIASELNTNPAGLASYISKHKNLISWDDQEMAYVIPVPKDAKTLDKSGDYDMSNYKGEMAKVYFSVSEKDKHLRNVTKTLETTTMPGYQGDGVTIPTNMGDGKNVNIVLPKGVIPISRTEPVYQIVDPRTNTVLQIKDENGKPKSKFSYQDLKNQYLQTKLEEGNEIAHKLDIQNKKYKQSQLSELDLQE